jgi:hypothetical protein
MMPSVYVHALFETIVVSYCLKHFLLAMGNSLSTVVSNIFTEIFQEVELDTPHHRPAKYLRHFDDAFVVWPYGPA